MSKSPVFSLTRLGAACAAVAALAVAQPVYAQTQAPAPAAEASASRAPELTLQATASSEVKQDTVRISLSAEVEAPDQPTAGKKLTAALDDVVKRARDVKGVEVRTGGYNVWPNTSSKGKIASWRGQGEVILESGLRSRGGAGVKLSDKTAISTSASCCRARRARPKERKLLKGSRASFPGPRPGGRQCLRLFGLSPEQAGIGRLRRFRADAHAPHDGRGHGQNASAGYSPDVPWKRGRHGQYRCQRDDRFAVRLNMMAPRATIGRDSHCPMLNPPASRPRKLSGSRVYSTMKRNVP